MSKNDKLLSWEIFDKEHYGKQFISAKFKKKLFICYAPFKFPLQTSFWFSLVRSINFLLTSSIL